MPSISERVLTLQSAGVTAPYEWTFIVKQGGTAGVKALVLARILWETGLFLFAISQY